MLGLASKQNFRIRGKERTYNCVVKDNSQTLRGKGGMKYELFIDGLPFEAARDAWVELGGISKYSDAAKYT